MNTIVYVSLNETDKTVKTFFHPDEDEVTAIERVVAEMNDSDIEYFPDIGEAQSILYKYETVYVDGFCEI